MKGKKIKNRKEDLREQMVEVEEEHEEFATFMIGEETYGVDILKVRDIIGITDITPVPKSPHFVKGVINLRGNIVPVVDLRLKFRMKEREYNSGTVIIVVEVKGRYIGMIVDSVSDVVDIKVESIHESPHYSDNIREDFIQSVGRKDDKLIIILDVDRILNTSEIEKGE
ncbi:MAG TPA: chemotaxis protein CheW [Spirochaetota bacterium]|nr:chemotaxis protein CheW [Spirochaetota bacterium]HPC41201.1 chemotaxis protein CheW [Spirochaetota bacterium]HPL17476.1 chemotaxis protein CheW [Spirochaetota bacterium]HQF08187.1 chemotaxis protein CheW [Spirochaetota bacterium]HQH96926.1 chemotaxis protein CheW [Spirochaetota bacterium]